MRLTKIKLKRLESGRQQIEVAQAARISRSRLSEIENGHVVPRADELVRLAATLGCETRALSNGTVGGRR